MPHTPTTRILTVLDAERIINQNAKYLDIPAAELSHIAGYATPQEWAQKIVDNNRNERIDESDRLRGPF